MPFITMKGHLLRIWEIFLQHVSVQKYSTYIKITRKS